MRAIPLLLPLILLLAQGPARLGAAAELVDGIAAQVGNEIVLVSEIFQAASPAEKRIRAEGGGDQDVEILRLEILERMIERALIRQVVKRAELGASETEVDQAVADIARENQLTVPELRSTVLAQGMPFQVYRERIRSEIEHRKVMSAMVASKVRLDEDEVHEVYDREFSDQPVGGEEFYLRQILITASGEGPSALSAACRTAGAARARIVGGEKFKAVASEVSEVNPELGGTIGWLHESELAAWMTRAVDGLEPGDVSHVVEAPFGCSVIEVVERRPHERITWEKAKDPLFEQIFERKMGVEYKEFIDEIRERTYIERKGLFAGTSKLDARSGLGDF